MNIIWMEGETFQLKQAIPRFIIWVLIVPFSWFIVQFTISIASILSVAILTLPLDSFPDVKKNFEETKICHDLTILKENWETKIFCDWVDKEKKLDLNNLNHIWVLNYYTFWIFKVDEVTQIDKDNIDSWWISVIIDILSSLWVWFIFILVFMLLLVAMFLALLIKWIYLWIFSVLSPVFWLLYFFKKTSSEWLLWKFTFKEFISLAMVPVYVSAALAFGLMFIIVAGTAITVKENDNLKIIQDSGWLVKIESWLHTVSTNFEIFWKTDIDW